MNVKVKKLLTANVEGITKVSPHYGKLQNNEALRTQINQNVDRTLKSLVYAKLALGSLIDDVADADRWQNFEKIGCYATIQTSNTISLDNTPSQPHEAVLSVIRCCVHTNQQ